MDMQYQVVGSDISKLARMCEISHRVLLWCRRHSNGVRSRDYQNSSGGYCLVPRPYYFLRPMSFGLRGLSEFLRLRQTRTSETLCVTLGGTFRSNLASCQINVLLQVS